MLISLANDTDLPALASIKSLYEQELGQEISNNPLSSDLIYLVAKEENQIVSAVFIEQINDIYQVPIVFTLKSFRNNQIATKLLLKLKEMAINNHISQIVLWPSPLSIPLYKRLGFTNQTDHYSLKIY